MASLRDFYMRTQGDPKYLGDRLEVNDDLEATVQGIMMTVFTRKGEVLGEPDFGLEVEKYLFEYSTNTIALAREASEQINKYVGETRKRQIAVRPSIYADERSNRDIFVLLIEVPEAKNSIVLFYD